MAGGGATFSCFSAAVRSKCLPQLLEGFGFAASTRPSAKELKREYLKRAKELHPDVNNGKMYAEFYRIQEEYEYASFLLENNLYGVTSNNENYTNATKMSNTKHTSSSPSSAFKNKKSDCHNKENTYYKYTYAASNNSAHSKASNEYNSDAERTRRSDNQNNNSFESTTGYSSVFGAARNWRKYENHFNFSAQNAHYYKFNDDDYYKRKNDENRNFYTYEAEAANSRTSSDSFFSSFYNYENGKAFMNMSKNLSNGILLAFFSMHFIIFFRANFPPEKNDIQNVMRSNLINFDGNPPPLLYNLNENNEEERKNICKHTEKNKEEEEEKQAKEEECLSYIYEDLPVKNNIHKKEKKKKEEEEKEEKEEKIKTSVCFNNENNIIMYNSNSADYKYILFPNLYNDILLDQNQHKNEGTLSLLNGAKTIENSEDKQTEKSKEKMTIKDDFYLTRYKHSKIKVKKSDRVHSVNVQLKTLPDVYLRLEMQKAMGANRGIHRESRFINGVGGVCGGGAEEN